ncbi:uncharacterized protein [Chironomus tepperi]|uniref:uncharacterized protein n=1 Tax=Chironomus tepperi TaxID=113505 RepID=UPI00391FA004
MFGVLLLLTCLTIIPNFSTSWTTIECSYKNNGDYHVIKNIYFCSVSNNPLIYTEESAQINSVNGEHMTSKSYDDVIGFHARQKIINFFPRGLQTYFRNIKVIHINSCGLKEIRQSDLKAFTKLIYLFLESNSIEVIEEGLFDNNPNLEAVGLRESSIIHIDPKVFDTLSNLSSLWLSLTFCAKKDVRDSKDKVKELITLVKNNCTSSDFRVQSEQLEVLENDLITSNFEDSKKKIENFELSFNNSKFLRFRPLKDKLVSLKNLKPVSQNNTIVELAPKVDLEPEICSNDQNFESVYKNLSTAMKHEFDNIKTSLSDLKISKYDDSEDKFTQFGDKFASIDRKLTKLSEKFDEKFGKIDNFEKTLTLFEIRSAAKYDKIDKELVKIRGKIGTISEDVKGIEERLAKKFEEILEQKLGKVFEF